MLVPALCMTLVANGLGSAAERITFTTDNAEAPISIGAYLSVPAGDGPFPAAILMHGCTGLERESASMPWRGLNDHARFLNDHGYVTLIVDSHGSRGIRVPAAWHDSCRDGKGFRERVGDAYGAAAYLESLPVVAKGRIALIGLSQGGSTVLNSLAVAEQYRRKPRLSAGVAIYPDCIFGGHPQAFYAPILILAPELDDITPLPECKTVVKLAEAGKEKDEATVVPELQVLVGTHHAFDLPLTRQEVTPIGTVAPNSSALAITRKSMLAFFDRFTKAPVSGGPGTDSAIVKKSERGIKLKAGVSSQQAYELAVKHCAEHRKRSAIVSSPPAASAFQFVCY